jgi:hypothetical protein
VSISAAVRSFSAHRFRAPFGEGPVVVIAHGAARHAEDAGARRNLSGLVAVIKGRQNLALGQIARRAEDRQIENLDRDDTRGHFLCSAI